MKKRSLSLLLVMALLLSCLSGCANGMIDNAEDSDKEKPQKEEGHAVEVVEDLGLSDAFVRTLSRGIVFLLESANSYVKGRLTMIDGGAAPVIIDEILYLPAAFTAQAFRADSSWDEESETLCVQWEDNSMTIVANNDTLTLNESSVKMEGAAVVENGVLLAPAQALCQAFGRSSHKEEDLIIIGESFEEAKKDVPEETVNLVMSSLRSRLSPVSGAEVDSKGEKTYADWAKCTQSIVIDPTMAPWTSKDGELAAVSGSLYVDSISITPTEGDSFDCTMTIYNYMGYTYGSVEVYNSDDGLEEIERIKPFSGQKSSVTSAVCDIGILMNDIKKAVKNWDLDHLNYKSELNSQINTVTVNVPAGGYVIITCNPMHSDHVAVYNAIHTFVELSSSAGDMAELCTGVGSADSVKDIMKQAIQEELMSDPTVVAELAAEYRVFLSKIEGITWFDVSGFAEKACEELLNMFERVEIDIFEILESAAKAAGAAVADFACEQFLTTLIPATELAFAGWKITTNASNLVCLLMDLISTQNAKSLMIETFDWRAAYAAILRDFPMGKARGNVRFMTCYVDNDMVPELVIIDAVAHFGNTMWIYSYQDRNIVQLDYQGSTDMNVPYASFVYVELAGLVIYEDMHQGFSQQYYRELQGTSFRNIHSFSDNEGLVSGTDENPAYTYNDATVLKSYYQWKRQKLLDEYKDQVIVVSGFSDGYDLMEANIKKVFE